MAGRYNVNRVKMVSAKLRPQNATLNRLEDTSQSRKFTLTLMTAKRDFEQVRANIRRHEVDLLGITA